MTGLSVALAYKKVCLISARPVSILWGTMSAIVVALSLDTSKIPAGLVWILAFLTAAVLRALFGVAFRIFKAFLNVNEVITSIMTNWIAANLVTIIFDNSKFRKI